MGLLWNVLWLLLDIRTVLLFAFLLLVLRWFLKQPKILPPGPSGFPMVGSLPTVIWELRQGVQPHQLLAKYAARFGPVFSLSIANKTLVILSDYASVHEAFQHPQLSDRPMEGLGVSVASGEMWIILRRFCLTVLKSFGVGKSSFEEKISTEGEKLLKEMAAFNGKPFNPKLLLGCAVSNVICSVVFGKRYEYTDQEFIQLLSLLSDLIRGFGRGGLLYFFKGLSSLPFFKSSYQLLIARSAKIDAFIKKSIDAHRASFDADNLRDVVDVYLMETWGNPSKDDEGKPSDEASLISGGSDQIVEERMVLTIKDLFLAGSETTATTLEWSILYMAIYPDIQQKVQAEIDAAVGRNRLPRLADKPQLNLTRAVVWEIQRMASIVPLGLFHSASADVPFRGFLIPKGTILVPNMWNIFRDPELWPEPEKFKPERFLDDEGKAFRPNEFIPFGTGRRVCIGEHLASMELIIFFSYIMHQFTFNKPGNSPPLTLEGQFSLTVSPLPFKICAFKRD